MNTPWSAARARAWRRPVGAAAAALALVGCTASKDAVDQTAGSEFRFTNATPQGQVIPAAERRKPGAVGGPLLTGTGTYSLAADAGKVVVVNLWGSWCGPCKVETPEFQQVYLATRDQGVNFVGFDVKEGGEELPRAFVADNQITYPIVYDPATKVALQLGRVPVQGLPLTVLVDKTGRVAAAYVGLTQPSALKPAISTLLAEQ